MLKYGLAAAALMGALFITDTVRAEEKPLASQTPPTLGVVTDKAKGDALVNGWSAKKDIIGKEVINDASPPKTICHG